MMGQHHHLAGGATALPLALLAQAIPMLSRNDLEALTERLIDYLDDMDGDTDLSPNGDELDGSLGEDDFCGHNGNVLAFPGCPLSDPDMAVDDEDCDDIDQDHEPEHDQVAEYEIDQTALFN